MLKQILVIPIDHNQLDNEVIESLLSDGGIKAHTCTHNII